MIAERLSRLGRWIGDLNDRTSSHDSRYYAGVRWRIVDRFAGWLYTLPDRAAPATETEKRAGAVPPSSAPDWLRPMLPASYLHDTETEERR